MSISSPLYRLCGVTKCYEGAQSGVRTVLNVAGLAIPRGSIMALVGPSGAGKSTLLRLLNWLETPDSGEIRFDNNAYGAENEPTLAVRRRVTTVFQRPVLLQRSVAENVAYGLRLRGQRHDDARVAQALADVGLEALATHPARTLSGGEAQRVALARAIILEPTALLLDEPTANLDPYNVGMIEQTVRRLNETRGTTIVLVTHNVFQAQRLAHRVALLLEGVVVEEGPSEQFFHAPHDARTGAFVRGEMVY